MFRLATQNLNLKIPFFATPADGDDAECLLIFRWFIFTTQTWGAVGPVPREQDVGPLCGADNSYSFYFICDISLDRQQLCI